MSLACKLSNWDAWFECVRENVNTAVTSELAPNLSQIGPKWDKSGTFKDQFQYILARWLTRQNKTFMIYPSLFHHFID